MGGRSYSPSPPPRGCGGYGRRGRSPSSTGRYGGGSRGRDLPTSHLVRNLRLDCRRPEDLRRPFRHFGHLKDIYLPRDYYSGEPRGFGFVQFVDPADAAEAKYQMDGKGFQGRELAVVFAEENRKKPTYLDLNLDNFQPFEWFDRTDPFGVLNVVMGDAPIIGNSLLKSPQVRKITFTGSTAAGKKLMAGAAETVKKLESKFLYTGQACICTNR